jgi:Flp pilus assembly protein TadB
MNMSGMIFLVAVLAILLVLWLFYPRAEKTGVLAGMYTAETAKAMQSLDPNSLEYQLLAAGLQLKPVSFRMLNYGAAAAAFAIGTGLLGFVVGIVLAGVAWYIPQAWLKDKVQSRGKQIDRVLPIAIGRIAAGLLAGGSPVEVLQQTADSMDIEGKNPLSPELSLTAMEMRVKDRREALHTLAERSPSTSLANLAMLLDGYVEAGGGKYAETLLDISGRVQKILMARNRASAKAGDVMVSAMTLPGALVLVIGYLAMDPLMAKSLHALPVQIVLGGVIVTMVVGYFVMRSIVQEAV